MVKVELDTRGFSLAVKGISQALNVPVRNVVWNEAGLILKRCAGWTKVAPPEMVDRRARKYAIRKLGYSGRTRAKDKGAVTINAGWRPAPFGRVWVKKSQGMGRKDWIVARTPGFGEIPQSYKGDGVFRRPKKKLDGTAMRWSAEVGTAVNLAKDLIPRYEAAGQKAAGLARQSWVQIADDLGIRLEYVKGQGASAAAIKKARAAIASDGKFYQNGQAQEFNVAQGYFVQLVNSLPYNRRVQLPAILISAVNSRAAYYAKNVEKGVFDHIEQVKKRYPGLAQALTRGK